MVELAEKILWLVVRHLTSPISVEVSYLKYEDFTPREDDPVVVCTGYPRRYHVKLVLTNRSNRVVYVVAYSACIGDEHRFAKTRFDNPYRIEAHEPKTISIVLPLDEDSEPIRKGRFTIDVWPSSGRRTKVSGLFPITE